MFTEQRTDYPLFPMGVEHSHRHDENVHRENHHSFMPIEI